MAYEFEIELNTELKKTQAAQKELHQAHNREEHYQIQEKWGSTQNTFWKKPDPFFVNW